MEDFHLGNEIERDGVLYHAERLHDVPDLINECCDLINMEWQRSHAARMKSIESSSENFPMSLVLVRSSGKPKVVGHCKISKIPFSTTKVFVEIVVIHPELRGKGLGMFLMKKCEEVCRSKNIKWIYLTTLDKEVFYEKLGYYKCSPINIYNCQLNYPNENVFESEGTFEKSENFKNKSLSSTSKSSLSPPPPPPLPLPTNSPILISTNSFKTCMRKEIIY